MKQKTRTRNQNEYIELLKRRLFYVSASFVGLVELIDLFLIVPTPVTYYTNSFIALIMFVVIIFYRNKKISLLLSNSIVIYVMLFDILFSPYFRLDQSNFDAYFLRLSLVVFAIIPYASFTVSKYQSLIIGTVYYLNFLVILVLSKNPFLQNGIVVITFAHIAFVIGVYYITHNLMKALDAQANLIENEKKTNIILSEQKEELNRAIESKDTLFSIISHDLKAPFNSILGFVQLISDDIREKDYENLEYHQMLLKRSSQNAYFLLQNLLDWARTEKGAIQFYPISLNPAILIKNVFELLKQDADKKKIILEMHLDGVEEMVADKEMLSSVFRNLITNALKYTSLNGRIVVTALQQESDYQFTIRDSGIGATRETLSKMFSEQAVKSTPGTENETGTGLGLIICKSLIEKHNGKIWAFNNIDKGLSVRFTIPVMEIEQSYII